ncbi:MAG: hypothetical protein ACPLRS_03965, partial [Hydrogenobacter sp.]
SELTVWIPHEVSTELYHLCGLHTIGFSPKEPYLTWLSHFDAIIYYITPNSYHKMVDHTRLPGIALLEGDVPFPTYTSYEDAILNFLHWDHPFNDILAILSSHSLKQKTLAPRKHISASPTPEDLLRDIFISIRLADAFKPLLNFMVQIRQKFFSDASCLEKDLLKSITKELTAFYETYKPFVETFSE